MTIYKPELALEDIASEWKMLYTKNNHVWYKLEESRFLPKGTFLPPEQYDLLKYLKDILGYKHLIQVLICLKIITIYQHKYL